MYAIETYDLRRTYCFRTGLLQRTAHKIEAVRGLTFHVRRGELFGLLGPNGAGKTTTIKMLGTLLIPTSGTARVLGKDVVSDAKEIRHHIGHVFGGDKGLYDRVSAYDNLRYFADLYGVDCRRQRTRIDSLLELVGLKGREQERVEGYSRGMRQRLHIARGLLHDPTVIFLDEPTIGVDPVGARELRKIIANLTSAGKTVMLTTHYMFEADELCDRIAVIARGRLIAEGTPKELKTAGSERRILEIEVKNASDELVERLRRIPGITNVAVEARDGNQVLLVQLVEGLQLVQKLLGQMGGAEIIRIDSREPTLEDVYLDLMGKSHAE